MTPLRCTLGLACLLLAGCNLLPTLPALPTPVRPPDLGSVQDALGAALQGDYPLDALTVHYEIGNPNWQGRTKLTLHGSGEVRVVFERSGQQQSWQSDLTESRVLVLLRLLADHEVWTIKGLRGDGVPDEAHPMVTIEAQGFEPLQVGMWQGEARQHPDFGPIMTFDRYRDNRTIGIQSRRIAHERADSGPNAGLNRSRKADLDTRTVRTMGEDFLIVPLTVAVKPHVIVEALGGVARKISGGQTY